MRLLELFEEINSLGGKMYSDPDGGSYQSIGFWHNPKTNQYVEVNWGWDRGEDAIDKHHSDAVMQNPEQFGLPSEFDFTDFGTDEAVEAVVPNGWNRVGVFHQMASIDAASLKLAARTTTWLLRNGYNIASLMIDIVQKTTGTTHINGTESVEMFARTGRVPRARIQEDEDPLRPWKTRGSSKTKIKPDGTLYPEQIEQIRKIRKKVRDDEGEDTGMCHMVSEVIENKFGWPKWGGVYTAPNGDMICSAHLFNVLPNGALLDATADQFGEGHDIRIIQPDDPEYQRYRMEFDMDYNPDLADHYPELKGVEWSGEHDFDAQNRLRKERGQRWWIGEAIRVREPQDGLLYRWVEPRKALSNLKTNSLNPGKWKHDIPGVGHLAGISFGYSQGAWRIDDADVCFVVDRGKMNPKKFVDIPAQEVYNYSTARHHPVGDAAYADEYKKGILDPEVEPTEAFYVGIVRPLNKVLDHIIIQDSVQKKPKLLEAVKTYAGKFGVPVRWYNGAELDLNEDIYRSNSPCVPLAILRVTDTDPDEVQNACVASNWSERAGMNTGQMVRAVKALGFDYKSRFDLMFGERELPDGRKVRRPRTLAQLMKVIPDQGRFLVNVKQHTVAIVDGKLLDDAKYGLRHRVEDVMEVFPQGQGESGSVPMSEDSGMLEPTERNISKAKAFVYEKWKERAKERGHSEPSDLSGACKFASLFAQALFGGEIKGNEQHQYVETNGKIIDLTVDAADVQKLLKQYQETGETGYKRNQYGWDEWVGHPHTHDSSFFTRREAKTSINSCRKRVEQWVREFTSSLNEDWDEDYEPEEWEPETTTIRRGTPLYHGSNSEWDGSNPNPPFWVSDARDVAEWFATWKDDDGEPTLYTYQADDDLVLVAMHDRRDMEEVAERLHLDGADDPTEFAEDICRHLGLDGWIIPNNYQTGADIMLCNPRQQLRMVDARPLQESLTEAQALPYKSWINSRTQQVIKVDDHTNHSWTVYQYPDRFGLSEELIRTLGQIDDFDDVLHDDDLYEAVYTQVKDNHWVRCEIDQFSALFDGRLQDCRRVMKFTWDRIQFQQADVETDQGFITMDDAMEIEQFIKTGRV